MTPIMTRAEAAPAFKSTMSEGKKVSEALCHEKENVVEDGTCSNTFTKVKKKKKKKKKRLITDLIRVFLLLNSGPVYRMKSGPTSIIQCMD